MADPFPRAGHSFLDSFFILFFLPDLEQGHPEVLMLCPSPPLGLALWTLTLACTGMEFATPSWASCPRPLALSPCPGQFPKAPSYFCSRPSPPFSPWQKLSHTVTTRWPMGQALHYVRAHLRGLQSHWTLVLPASGSCPLGSGDLLNAFCLG